MNLKSYSPLRAGLLLALAVLFIWADYRLPYFNQAKSRVAQLIYPVYHLVELPLEWSNRAGKYFLTKNNLIKENEKLHRQMFESHLQLIIANQQRIENESLRKILHSSPLPEKTKVSRLVSIKTTPFSHFAVLYQDQDVGLYKGQPVLDASGVVGLIDSIGFNHAKIRLITDPQIAIPVESPRTGERTIVYGTGSLDKLEIRDVSITADLKVGDTLVTSGLGGKFLPGYPVGIITQIKYDGDKKYKNYLVKRHSEKGSSRYVFVVDARATEDTQVNTTKIQTKDTHFDEDRKRDNQINQISLAGEQTHDSPLHP